MAKPSKLWVPDRRDMIWIDFSPQVGGEMRDAHPMLVLSPKAFNERTNLVIGLPMTHAQSNDTNPFAVKFTTSKRGGLLHPGTSTKIICMERSGRSPTSMETSAASNF
jgi:mRNA-degrading endonuclease toxin of MazEF toxin-antitoxin module